MWNVRCRSQRTALARLGADAQRYARPTGERRLDDDAHLFQEDAHLVVLAFGHSNVNGVAECEYLTPLIRLACAAVPRPLATSLRNIGEEGCHPVIPDRQSR